MLIVPAMSATQRFGGADPIIGGTFFSNIPGEAMRPHRHPKGTLLSGELFPEEARWQVVKQRV
jgi:hypothetical protein